jgi:hypothetical protein
MEFPTFFALGYKNFLRISHFTFQVRQFEFQTPLDCFDNVVVDDDDYGIQV